METRITKLLKIKYPIIQGGMVWVSGYKLALAVSIEGGFGLIGAGSMKPENLENHIRKLQNNTDKPFGVNLPLLRNDIDDLISIVISNGVKYVFTSAGSPAKYTSAFRRAGITTVHVIASVKQAIKSEDSGVDAVVAEGFEAGGHNGVDEITTLCLIPQVVDAINIPVIAAGGIADGRGMAAAVALGAEGVQIGTRFAASVESSAHAEYKNAVLNAKDNSTQFVFRSLSPIRAIQNDFTKTANDLESLGASKEKMKEILGSKREMKGIFDGDLKEGLLEAGQSSGMIKEVLTVKEIFHKLLDEYEIARKRIIEVL